MCARPHTLMAVTTKGSTLAADSRPAYAPRLHTLMGLGRPPGASASRTGVVSIEIRPSLPPSPLRDTGCPPGRLQPGRD
ncbi:hypothetical protein GCM10025331_39690 [Actinoplanes utahensis]